MTDLERTIEMLDRASEKYEINSGEDGTIIEVDVGMLGFSLHFNSDGLFEIADAPEWY
jgi:hypothetical protein